MAVDEPPTATAEPRTKAAVYCYGVVAATADEPASVGVAEAHVELVRCQDLAALTSGVESTRVRARRRDLLRHSEVLAQAVERTTVLPFRFGTVFASGDALIDDFLAPRHDELVRLLRQFEDCVELNVKAFYREDVVLAEIVEQDPRVARLREATQSAPPAATYPLRVELGERVAGALGRRTRHDADELLRVLRPLALEGEIDPQPLEHQVLRASFLVARKRLRAFDKAMDELARKHAPRIQFKYIGPLAPHSFVNLVPGEHR